MNTSVPTLLNYQSAIQPFGCVLGLDLACSRILWASENLEQIIGIVASQALIQTPASLFGERFIRELQSGICEGVHRRFTFIKVITALQKGKKAEYQLSARCNEERIIIEIERLPRQAHKRLLAITNNWLGTLAEEESEESLLDTLVKGVRVLTGYDRVMVYRLETEKSASVVIAEDCNQRLSSLFEHYLTASHIQPQPKELYELNPVRYIPDAHAEAITILTHEDECEYRTALRLSYLCAISPDYRAYLDSMGARASLSFAIYKNDEFWGLVVCHASKAITVSPAQRDAARVLVQMASQRFFLLQYRRLARYAQRVLDSRFLVTKHVGQVARPADIVEEYGERWLSLFNACGVALINGDKCTIKGQAPHSRVLQKLTSRLRVIHHDLSPWHTANLADTRLKECGEMRGCAGLLALPLSTMSPIGWLLLFRRERPHTEHWAGPERKSVKQGCPQYQFVIRTRSVIGESAPWLPEEVSAAADLAEDLAVTAATEQIAALNAQLKATGEHFAALARTDTLTGISNRYHIEECIEKELFAAARYKRPCSLILFDIDHFKQINDTLGHEAGDQVLQWISQSVNAALRATDQLGRWGGEEFLVLAADTVLSDCMLLAERLRTGIASLSLDGGKGVTVSMGVASYQDGDNVKTLVARADAAMYQAKNGGRNKVVCIE